MGHRRGLAERSVFVGRSEVVGKHQGELSESANRCGGRG